MANNNRRVTAPKYNYKLPSAGKVSFVSPQGNKVTPKYGQDTRQDALKRRLARGQNRAV